MEVALNHNFDDDAPDMQVVDDSGGKSVMDTVLYDMLKDLCRREGKALNLPPYVSISRNIA
jgi:hypothetical protein